VADPEQLYQEVLSEEQGKGVSPAVAEGRAKAARKRAEEGSPHPKEPKWWPGSQPHFEGGGGEAEAEAAEEPAAEEAPAEEPAAEAPAEEATADVQADEVEQEQTPAAPAAPAEQPAAAATAEQPAAAAPAQPAATEPAAQTAQPTGTIGVSHGTATGTRLRPEDEVSTEAQFEGQKAMYERRKLIDDLVATGVPAVTASDTDRPRTPWLAILYLLIPLLVIFYIASEDNGTEAEEGVPTESEAPAEEGGGEEGGGGGLVLVAEGTAWQQDTLTFVADEPNTLEVENADPTVHNMSVYPDEAAAQAKQDPLFTGPDVNGGETATYEVDPLEKGEYTYICDYHANMVGDLVVE
jgi:plastocyanin